MADDTNTPEIENEGRSSFLYYLILAGILVLGLAIGAAIIYFAMFKPEIKEAAAQRSIADSTAKAQVEVLETEISQIKETNKECSRNLFNSKDEMKQLRDTITARDTQIALLDSTLTETKTALAHALSSKKGKKTAAEPAATGSTASTTLPAGVTGKSKPR